MYNEKFATVMIDITKLDKENNTQGIAKKLSSIDRNSYLRLLVSEDSSVNDLARKYQTYLGPDEHPEFNFRKVNGILLSGRKTSNNLMILQQELDKIETVCLSEDVVLRRGFNSKLEIIIPSNKFKILDKKKNFILLDNTEDLKDITTFIIDNLSANWKIITLDDQFVLPVTDLYVGNKFCYKCVKRR